MAQPEEIDRSLALAAARLVEEAGWQRVGPRAIADAAGLSLADIRRRLPAMACLPALIQRTVDAEVLAGVRSPVDGDESPRDRLFDLLMRRFDALLPYRPALRRLAEPGFSWPARIASMSPGALVSMRWMLEAAAIPTGGLFGAARIAALAGIYALAFRIWLDDDSPDLARTMASLDQQLARAEELANSFARRRPAEAPSPAGGVEGIGPLVVDDD